MRSIRWSIPLLALLCLPALGAIAQGALAPTGSPAPAPKAVAPAPAPRSADPAAIQRGHYLVTIGGCEDCHTPKKFDPELGMPVNDESLAFSGHPKDAPDPEGTVGKHDMGLIGPTFTAFKMPFGTVYASNITSDEKTGIGKWTEAQFIQAMRSGRRTHTYPLLPPMPWQNLARMNDDDLRAVYAFLQSTRPISNSVKPPSVPKPVADQIGAGNDKLAATLQKAAAATASKK
ncbi:MAG TPA: diheme cytochrome c-553 [Vulgatibacter sp.]|nr:diheme cytochrome c-553 [Vulgatibacter sp.]